MEFDLFKLKKVEILFSIPYFSGAIFKVPFDKVFGIFGNEYFSTQICLVRVMWRNCVNEA